MLSKFVCNIEFLLVKNIPNLISFRITIVIILSTLKETLSCNDAMNRLH